MRASDPRRLWAYVKSLELLADLESIATLIPRERRDLKDQLRRAATSVCLNLAEGAGEFSPAEKARFYRMARRSATECMAMMDVLAIFAPRILRREDVRGELDRLVGGITVLARTLESRQ